MRTCRAGIVRRVTVWRIRRNGRCIRVRDALRLAEQRQEDERSKNRALHNDGNRERTAADAALPTALSGIAFDKTSAQRTKSFFWHIFRNVLRFERHHTPPQNLLRVLDPDRVGVTQNGISEILRRRFPGGCSRSPGDRRRARRDVRLRASSLRWTPRVGTSSHGLWKVRPRQSGEKASKLHKLPVTVL